MGEVETRPKAEVLADLADIATERRKLANLTVVIRTSEAALVAEARTEAPGRYHWERAALCTWPEIAKALGVSRQAVQARHS